jgi:hypothetical protein
VASPAEFNVWNPCNAVFADVDMAERTIQPGDFLMVDMIKADRLIDRFTPQNREKRKDKRFRRDPKPMPRNGDEKKNQNNRCNEPYFFHRFSLFAGIQTCPFKISRPRSASSGHKPSSLSTERSEATRTEYIFNLTKVAFIKA